MASKTFNVGIVGYGFSAKTFHIPFIQDVPQFKLYAVVQRTPKPEDDAEKDHPGIKSYRSAEELVQDAGVDVVVITTAPDSHFYLAKLALEAGKHGRLFSTNRIGVNGESRLTMGSCLREAFYPHIQGS
jgi:predicted dehydrogenase